LIFNKPKNTMDYEVHPWILPFGPAFGYSNSFQTNLSGLRRNDGNKKGRLAPFRMHVRDAQFKCP